MHIEAGVVDDLCGIAVGRVIGLSEVNELRSYMPDKDTFVSYGGGIKAPIFMIDGIMGIVPPPGDEIDLNKVLGVVFTLIKMGINLRWLSMDRFASPQMLQTVRKYRDVQTKLLSVDSPLTPYLNFKLAYREYRIIHPPHSILYSELKNLELDRKKGKQGKVDHPVMNMDGKKGTKDIADAVCGTCTLLGGLRDSYDTNLPLIDQYQLAGIDSPSAGQDDIDPLETPEHLKDLNPDERRSTRRSARNPDRPRRGETREQRVTRFRHRMI